MYLLNHQTSEQYVTQLRQAGDVVKQWLDANNVYSGGSPQQLRDSLKFSIGPNGRELEAILADVQNRFLPGCVSTAHSHCLAHLHPPTLIISQVAEMLIAATNQSMDSWNQSPAATYIEKSLISWLCQLCQFDHTLEPDIGSQSGGVFTSGGTQSNLMGLLLARNKFYTSKNVDVQKDGLSGQASGIILCSKQAHFSIAKNAALLGLGQNCVEDVDTDDKGAMSCSALQHKIDEVGADNIMAVIATVGTTDLGAIDPLTAIAGICANEQIWLHLDAAWGAALLLSERYRHLIDGMHLADSITLDFHKHFFLPSSCGAFLLRDRQNFESIRQHSEYLNSHADQQDNIPNLVTYSLQTTRRFDALKLWMALDLLGTDNYATLIDACLDTAREAAKLVDANDNFVLLHTPIISSLLFYFKPKNALLTKERLAQLNRHISQELLINNIANVATTQFDQQLCLKFTILNPHTQISDIENIIEHMTIAGFNQLNLDGDTLDDATENT